MRSPPVWNRVRRWVADAISFVVINVFVCSVIPCLEVSSRGYLIASDDAFVCSVTSYSEVKWVVFENWFRNPPPPPPQKNWNWGGGGGGGRGVSEKTFISSRDGAVKSTETRCGWENLKNSTPPRNPTPLRNNDGPFSGLERNAFASLVHFVTYTTKRTRDASALLWRPEMGPASFRSGIGFLRFSHPCLVSVLLTAPSLLEMKFSQKLFSLSWN